MNAPAIYQPIDGIFFPSAEIIGDAINSFTGKRLTTFKVTYHRFITAEFNTHRMLSKNASSSRAIPVKKLVQKMWQDNVEPVWWGAAQKGMQAKEELTGVRKFMARALWHSLRAVNALGALGFNAIGVHKQIANRVIEPYATITMIVSATEWGNFFSLRAHPDAQPEFQALAYQMQELYDSNVPMLLRPGDVYIPPCYDIGEKYSLQTRVKAAVGKIARVSYLTHEGEADVNKDVQLFMRLVGSIPRHSSPTEHVAFATQNTSSGNFGKGWVQLRKHIEDNPSQWT
jgi:thymidylate synthase ThyX